jgi:hypothetical protein
MSEIAQNRNALPSWATEMISLYESRSVNQFILHGNVNDRFYLPLGNKASLGAIRDFLLRVLLPGFDLILSYDLGNGIRVEKGGEIFSQWTGAKESLELPRQPRPAIELLTRFFRYVANLTRLGKPEWQVACYVRACHLVAPALPGALNYDLNALALLLTCALSSSSLLSPLRSEPNSTAAGEVTDAATSRAAASRTSITRKYWSRSREVVAAT